MKHILERRTARGEGRGTDKPSEKAEDAQTGEIVHERRGDLQDAEEGERDDVWDRAADLRDLADWREKQWAHAVAHHEELIYRQPLVSGIVVPHRAAAERASPGTEEGGRTERVKVATTGPTLNTCENSWIEGETIDEPMYTDVVMSMMQNVVQHFLWIDL